MKANPAAKTVNCENVKANTVPACWFTPPHAVDGKVFYYIHGGGWFTGSPAASKDFCMEIALATNLRVFSIDYRMYPAYPHPAQVDDAAQAYDWLVESGITPENIVVGGESAGGHVTILLLNRLKTTRKSMPAGAVLVSPPFDLSFSDPEIYKNIPSDPVLGLSGSGVLIINLLRNTRTDTSSSSDFSPVNFDLAGFPPLLLQASTCEVMYHDAEMLRDKAQLAGVDITFQAWDGMIHAFPVGARKEYKEVKEANAKIAEFICKVLSI
jgi:monoterpene epsilon-lactone hydrolase